MGESLDATEEWAQALRALWTAAGKPVGEVLRRQAAAQRPPANVSSSSWSDWRNGKNVPADPRTARWLISYLRMQAGRKAPLFDCPDDSWWERIWQKAREERQAPG